MIAPPRHARDQIERVGFDRARELLLAAADPLPPETIALDDAHDRVAAAVCRSQADLIPYARSAMDGYAVRAIDTAGASQQSVALPVSGRQYVGEAPSRLIPGCATAIATGAPLPFGADAVVPVECVLQRGDVIVLAAPLTIGQHVFPAGGDAQRGDILIRPGDSLTPGRIALLAAAGFASIRVHCRPRVAVVCTGDEVVPVKEQPGPGEVRNSNAAMLAAHIARDGGELIFSAHAGDSRGPLQAALRRALEVSDLVITTGGASVGERDFVKSTLAELGTRFAFRSISLRPAKPTAFGRCGSALVAVSPGNPAAAFVAYATLVRGLVRRLTGRLDAFAPPIAAVLQGSIQAKADRHFVMFAQLAYSDRAFSVQPLGNQCSSLVRTSADANALIIVPPGVQRLGSGAQVAVEVLDWSAVRFGP